MDPVAYIFSAYLDSVQSSISNHMNETKNLEITPVIIEYKGTQIPFQHQLWKIRPESICGNTKNNIGEFSNCTIKASELFYELCNELNDADNKHWKASKLNKMYCNAAVSFESTTAYISNAENKSDLEKARSECNVATSKAMGTKNASLIEDKNKKCKTYQELKESDKKAL